MAKIRVYLHGELISELALWPGQEYFAGRGSQSHLHLAAERGISRQHVKFFEHEGKWHAHLVSKYGGMIYEGQTVESIELNGVTRFSIPPYDFVFEEVDVVDATAPIASSLSAQSDSEGDEKVAAEDVVENESSEDISPESENIGAEEDRATKDNAEGHPHLTATDSSQGDRAASTSSEPSAAQDRTVVAQPARLTPYLKIINNKLKTEEVLKLEGSSWQLGRNPECEIVINDSAISRKHLELAEKDGAFYVTDHGSSNGTLVNGTKIESGRPHQIKHGDVMTVRHLELLLELRDANFENKVQALPHDFESQEFDLEDDFTADQNRREQLALTPYAGNPQGGVVLRVPPGGADTKFAILKNRRNQIIIAVVVLLVSYLAMNTNQNNTPVKGHGDSASHGPQNANLTPDQQKQVVDFFNLAHSYYTEKKYTLCLSQLQKMTQLTPFYQNSKELENLCEQGQEDEARALDRQRKEQEQAQTQSEIQANVDECRKKLDTLTTTPAMRACLDQALQLDPENPMVMDLLQQVAVREQQAKDEEQKILAFRARKQEGERIFANAETFYKSGNQKRALAEFKRFLNAKFPGLNQDEDVASRRIASIQKGILDKISAGLASGEDALSKGDLKTALKASDTVLKEDPKNSRALDLRHKAYTRLEDQLKEIYEDSVLDENMGNLDSAKQKWCKILKQSMHGENYYDKSQVKLQQYGSGCNANSL